MSSVLWDLVCQMKSRMARPLGGGEDWTQKWLRPEVTVRACTCRWRGSAALQARTDPDLALGTCEGRCSSAGAGWGLRMCPRSRGAHTLARILAAEPPVSRWSLCVLPRPDLASLAPDLTALSSVKILPHCVLEKGRIFWYVNGDVFLFRS